MAGVSIDMKVIMKACSLAMEAHKFPDQQFRVESSGGSSEVVFSFPAGSWSEEDWYSKEPFGAKTAEGSVFSSNLRSIGNDEFAIMNEAFLRRFELILKPSVFRFKVEEAVKEGKKIVFTGHSLGGPIAVLATIWFLQEFVKPNNLKEPMCVTFGSPLIGNHILPHALRRENWSHCFIHFVTRYDIVPRVLLAPLSSIQQQFHRILDFFKRKSTSVGVEASELADDAFAFYYSVMRNASTLASHVSCKLMGSTNLLLETVTNFIQLSPYRPFGTYIFCAGNGKLITLTNSNAILQLLFYSCQLNNEKEGRDVACRSLSDHFVYEAELKRSVFNKQEKVSLDDLKAIGEAGKRIDIALDDLGVSTAARLCLLAAKESEEQKQANKKKMDSKVSDINRLLGAIEGYRATCKDEKLGYYDAFKLQRNQDDFKSNVKRLELAGIWDEIIEMLKRYELPDEFEGQEDWIKLGTRLRRVLEPLDIANYYRHSKNEDTGPYLGKAGEPSIPRPKRYRYTQRWLEHKERMPTGFFNESCFLAEVEDLRICLRKTEDQEKYQKTLQRAQKLQEQVKEWEIRKEIGKDVFLKASTFVEWWESLPSQHKSKDIESLIIAANA
ncbi:hypothetical protein FNV43_RR20567 [Rhamnella rubrinervis]|uniref:Protein EDS1L-like n=1 Tax=Rhamnella rubrinervis TaxID=2594499 RepID=A0A8K0DW63_9ROSA|nr:hypothetical protein FNV43_RR20567 [Rhamnella rubrinervis]